MGEDNSKGDVVYVEWIDSAHKNGWVDKEDWGGDEPFEPCRTVAFFLSLTDEVVYLYGSEAECQYMGTIAIPLVSIKKYITLADAEDVGSEDKEDEDGVHDVLHDG